MRKSILAVAVLLLGVGVGCGAKTTPCTNCGSDDGGVSGDGGNNGDGGNANADMTFVPPISYDTFSKGFATQLCKWALKCCKSTELPTFQLGSTQMDCEASVETSVVLLHGCAADTTSGKVAFDGSRGRTCLDAVTAAAATTTCSAGGVAPLLAACGPMSGVLTSKRVPTDSCDITAVCASPYLVGAGCATATGYCDGNAECAAYVAKDGDCSGGGVCDPAAKQFCLMDVCTDFLATGMLCSKANNPDWGGCDPSKDFCDDQTTDECTGKKDKGIDCATSLECKAGLDCDNSTLKCVDVAPLKLCTGM